MRPLYITGRMGSGGEKKCCLFTQNMLHLTDSWNALTTAGAKQKKNGKEGRDEKRRKWEWSEEATHGSSFFSHVIPLIAFLQLSHWQDCREGKSAPTRTRSVTHARTNTCMYATLQCDRAAREKSWNDPLFFEHHLFLRRPQFHRVLACLWGNNNHMYRIGFFTAAEGIEVTIRFISRVKFYG